MLILRNIDEGDIDEVVDAINETIETLQQQGPRPEGLDNVLDNIRRYLDFLQRQPGSSDIPYGITELIGFDRLAEGDSKRLVRQVRNLLKVVRKNFIYGKPTWAGPAIDEEDRK